MHLTNRGIVLSLSSMITIIIMITSAQVSALDINSVVGDSGITPGVIIELPKHISVINYTIALNGSYVPYSGATGNVDLSPKTLTANSIKVKDSASTTMTITSGVGNENATVNFREADIPRASIQYSGLNSILRIWSNYADGVEDVLMSFNVMTNEILAPSGNFKVTNGNITAKNFFGENICYSNGTGCSAVTSGYVPYTGATNNVLLGKHNLTLDGLIDFGEGTGNKTLWQMNQTGDGFKMKYAYDFEALYDDWLIFEKTDGNDAVPDGGIGFVMTNASGRSVSVLKIDGTGLVNITQNLIIGGSVIGDINLTGNFTGNQIYGEIYWDTSDADDSSQWLFSRMPTAGTYYNFSNGTAGFSLSSKTNGFSFSGGNALTAKVSGMYKFDGTCDYYTKSGAHTDMTLFVNGAQTNFTTHRTATRPNLIQPIRVQNVTPMSAFNSDLLYADGTGLTFNELNGGPPVLDANFTFQLSGTPAVITNPLFLTYSGYYLGSDSHAIEITVWNFTGGAWVNIRSETKDLPNSGLIPYAQTWKFPDSLSDERHDFVNSSGAVKIRVQHTSNGVSSHVLFIDQFILSERRVYDRQTITGLVRINVGDTASVMMKKDFANAEVMIQRFDVNIIRVGN